MGISDIHVFPITITCLLQGTLCDTGIPCTFYGENICSVVFAQKNPESFHYSNEKANKSPFRRKLSNKLNATNSQMRCSFFANLINET